MIERATIRTDRWIALAIAVGLFAIYAWGACRTIYVGDSGELVTAVHVLGIPHPSGYPLYVLLGKLWTVLVPVGSIAFRMSLFSAACAGVTCALLYVTVRQDGGSRMAGLLGAGLLAFGPSFWQEANIQRVYALNALFVVLAINRAFAWHRDRRVRDLALAMFVCGLGATNHTVMGLVGVAVAVWAPIVDRSLVRRPRVVVLCGAAFFSGLLPYAWLPIRSRMNPVLNWGEPATFAKFLDVVLRRDYWERAWWNGPADLWPVALDWAGSLANETGFLGVALAAIAIVSGARLRWVLPLLILILNLLALARHGSFLDIFVWHRYYIPSYVVIGVLAARGLDALCERMASRRLVPLALAVPLVMFFVGIRANDHSGPSVADSFARQVLESLPPGARLLSTDDNVLFPLLYLKWVERVRPDVELIPMGVEQTKRDFSFDPDIDAVFFTHHPNWALPELEITPRGLVFQAVRAGRGLEDPVPVEPLEGAEQGKRSGDYLTRALIAHHQFMQALTYESRDWAIARARLDQVLEAAPSNDLSYYNVAMVLARNGFFDEALSALRMADEINPRGGLNLAPGAQPEGTRRYSASRQIVRVEQERARSAAAEAGIARTLSASSPGSRDWHLAMASALAREGRIPAARRHRILGFSNADSPETPPSQ